MCVYLLSCAVHTDEDENVELKWPQIKIVNRGQTDRWAVYTWRRIVCRFPNTHKYLPEKPNIFNCDRADHYGTFSVLDRGA